MAGCCILAIELAELEQRAEDIQLATQLGCAEAALEDVVALCVCDSLTNTLWSNKCDGCLSDGSITSVLTNVLYDNVSAPGPGRLVDGSTASVQVDNAAFEEKCASAASPLNSSLFDSVAVELPPSETCSFTLSEPSCLLYTPDVCPKFIDSISFTASISMPADVEQLGWQGQGAPGEDSLKLVVCTRGASLPVKLTETCRGVGERTILVCVCLPAALLTPGHCSRLELKLVKNSGSISRANSSSCNGRSSSDSNSCNRKSSSSTLCSRSILLMAGQLREETEGLKHWVHAHSDDQALVSSFVDDLAEFLSYQSLLVASSSSAQSTISSITNTSSSLFTDVSSSINGNSINGSSINGKWSSSINGSRNSSTSGTHSEALAVDPAFVLQAAQQQTEMHVMAELGLSLLQRAVEWGLAALSKRLLICLLTEPFGVPFAAIACGQLPEAYPAAANMQQQKRFWQLGQNCTAPKLVPPSQPLTRSNSCSNMCHARSLLTCALLSCDAPTLAQVLSWGRTCGGGSPCYAWLWSEVDASGFSPLHLMERLSPRHAMMKLLLAHPVSAPAAAHALATAACLHAQAEGTGSTSLTTHASTGAAAAAAGHSTPQQQLPAPFLPLPYPSFPPSSLEVALQSVVTGFGKQGAVNEADYRSWCRENTAAFGNLWCCLVLSVCMCMVIRCWNGSLYLNAAIFCLYATPLALALTATPKRQTYMTAGKVIHWGLVVTSGLGLLPSLVALKLAHLHLDWVVEVVCYRLFEQVQLKSLFLERTASCVGNSLLYERIGFSYPFGRALLLTLTSFGVGCAIDLNNRRLFLERTSSAARLRPQPQRKAGRR